jgi:hypothetical protein
MWSPTPAADSACVRRLSGPRPAPVARGRKTRELLSLIAYLRQTLSSRRRVCALHGGPLYNARRRHPRWRGHCSTGSSLVARRRTLRDFGGGISRCVRPVSRDCGWRAGGTRTHDSQIKSPKFEGELWTQPLRRDLDTETAVFRPPGRLGFSSSPELRSVGHREPRTFRPIPILDTGRADSTHDYRPGLLDSRMCATTLIHLVTHYDLGRLPSSC